MPEYPWAKNHEDPSASKHLYKNRTIAENMQYTGENIIQIGKRMDSAPHRSTLRGACEKIIQMIDLYEEREGVIKTETPSLTNANGDGPWIANYKGD